MGEGNVKTDETNEELQRFLNNENKSKKKRKKKNRTVLKIIIWILVIILLVFLTLLLSAWIAPQFNSMGELIRYLFNNSNPR